MCLASALAVVLTAAAPDPAALRFDDVTAAVGLNGHARSRELMEAWVGAHPSDANAGRGLIWIAQLYLADGETAQARPYFARAAREYPNTEWGLHGIRGTADLDLLDRHYSAAIQGYRTLAANPAPLWNYLGRMGVAQAESERVRFIWFTLAAFGLVALALWRVRLARKSGARWWSMPEEFVYVLPVCLVMIVASFRQQADEGHAVITVAVGGMLLLWANGVYLRARPPRRARRLVEAVLAIAQAGALLYCAVVANGIWMKFHDTLVMGAE